MEPLFFDAVTASGIFFEATSFDVAMQITLDVQRDRENAGGFDYQIW
jgi:hypothetical protein